MSNTKEIVFTKEQQEAIDLMMQQTVAKQNKELELKQEQRETNKVVIGARIQELILREGSPIVDKDTKQQKVSPEGVALCYPNKHFVKLEAMGVSIETEISKENFETLEEHRTYLCEGHIGLVKKFGSDFIEPIFRRFTKI